MKRASTVAALAVLTLAVGGAAAAPVGRQAGSQLTITVTGKIRQSGTTGTFELVGATAAVTDAGKISFTSTVESLARKTPQGLSYVLRRRTETLRGEHGTLVLRSTAHVYDMASVDAFVSSGTWSIVRGTGKYASYKGSGALVGLTAVPAATSSFSDYDFTYRYAGRVAGG